MGKLSSTKIKPEFARWMRSHLGYQAAETNMPIRTGRSKPTRFVDVRGETYGIAWHRLRAAAVIACAAGVLIRHVMSVPEGSVPVVPNVLIYSAIVAYVAAQLGRMRTRRYTWVQCKGLSKPVSCDDIVSLSDVVTDVKASATANWKPAEVFIVAGVKGFEKDAVSFARSHGVECYRRVGSIFERAP